MENNLGFSAVGWVHYRIAGGYKQILIVAAVYAALLVGLVAFMAHVVADGRGHVSPVDFYKSAARITLFLQGIVVLIFGTYRVAAAIRLDHATNMIESHRLMPLSSANAILGYLIGATSPAWALAVVNILVGTVLGALGGANIGQLMVCHAIMLTFAFFFWVLSALAALTARPFVGFLSTAPLILILTQGAILIMIPGLLLLTSPLLGSSIFADADVPFTPARGASLAGQLVIGSIFFVSAARRYRQPDKPAILPILGVSLLAVWIVLTILGIGKIPGMPVEHWIGSYFDMPRFNQFVGSSVLTLFIMIIPVGNAAWYFIHARRHSTPAAPQEARALSYVAASILITLASVLALKFNFQAAQPAPPPILFPLTGAATQMAPITKIPPPTLDAAGVGVMALSITGYALAIHFILRIIYRGGGQRAGLFAFLWIVGTVGLPLLFDLLRVSITQDGSRPISSFGAISPIGAIVLAFQPGPRPLADPLIGATIQFLLGAGMATLYYTSARAKQIPSPRLI